MKKRSTVILLSVMGVVLLTIVLGWYTFSLRSQPEAVPATFNGDRAYEDVKTQVSFGPRIPGTEGHDQVRAWIQGELEAAGWQVEIQETEALGHPVKNIVAKRGAETPQIVIGAHYDSRMYA
ncbi:MAG TPA: hypothetical protein VF243_00855, partial [Nitrosospira sp.]